MIRLADYPQLQLLAWSRPADATLDEAEAFALYEANWRLVEPERMDANEAALIRRLTQQFGAGLLLV
jgi:hypothetical protein